MKNLKIGKKKLLGFLTAGAIVVTMAGSYATWDQLTATTTSSLTLDKPVTTTLTMSGNEFQPGTRTLDAANTYTDTATFTVKDVPTTTNVKAVITPVVKNKNAGTDVTTQFNIDIKKDGASIISGNEMVDNTVSKDGNNTYTVELTPKSDDTSTEEIRKAATDGTVLDVEIKAELQTVTP